MAEEMAVIMSEVRGEMAVLQTELDHLNRASYTKSCELTRLRTDMSTWTREHVCAQEMQSLMAELHDLQHNIQQESARVLSVNEELESNNAQLYQLHSTGEIRRNENESTRRVLDNLHAEHTQLLEMVERLRWEAATGDARLNELEKRQREATIWQAEVQLAEQQEIGSRKQADTMANDIALKEGLVELLANMLKVNTQLTYEIDETMGVVQARNDILHGRMEDSRASTRELEGHFLGELGGDTQQQARRDYTESVLQELQTESKHVRQLHKVVDEERLATHTEEHELAHEMTQVDVETRQIRRDNEKLKAAVEERAGELSALQSRLLLACGGEK